MQFLLLALASLAAAAPTSSRHVLHEKRAELINWIKLDRVHQDVKLPMRIGLRQPALEAGHARLMDMLVKEIPGISTGAV